jgi:hypothetical protein
MKTTLLRKDAAAVALDHIVALDKDLERVHQNIVLSTITDRQHILTTDIMGELAKVVADVS